MILPILCPDRWFTGRTILPRPANELAIAMLYPPDDALPVPIRRSGSDHWRYWIEGCERPSRELQRQGYSIRFNLVSHIDDDVLRSYEDDWVEFDGWRPEVFERHSDDERGRRAELIAVTNAPLLLAVPTDFNGKIIPQDDDTMRHRSVHDRPPSSIPQAKFFATHSGRRHFTPKLAYHPDPARCVVNYPLP